MNHPDLELVGGLLCRLVPASPADAHPGPHPAEVGARVRRLHGGYHQPELPLARALQPSGRARAVAHHAAAVHAGQEAGAGCQPGHLQAQERVVVSPNCAAEAQGVARVQRGFPMGRDIQRLSWKISDKVLC